MALSTRQFLFSSYCHNIYHSDLSFGFKTHTIHENLIIENNLWKCPTDQELLSIFLCLRQYFVWIRVTCVWLVLIMSYWSLKTTKFFLNFNPLITPHPKQYRKIGGWVYFRHKNAPSTPKCTPISHPNLGTKLP